MIWNHKVKQRSAVYRIQEFASVAGVTVRALHHYDRLGLLKPSGRSAAGYRLYRDSDFARLEQIVVVKFLGLPLKEIGRLLRRESKLPDALRAQRRVLDEGVSRTFSYCFLPRPRLPKRKRAGRFRPAPPSLPSLPASPACPF
jgi:DNA-binding transcriptional MerR regulator